MGDATTRSPTAPRLPSRRRLERLKISREVAWYLLTRGIPLPDCPPAVKTPEPGEVDPGARFDPERVDRVLRAFGLLRHTKGRFAGRPLHPDPWQVAYILAPAFGWIRWDDESDGWVRCVNELYVDLPRKGGKSTLSGGIGIYLTCGDGEQGAEVIAAATTEKQAGYVFNPVKQLALKSPALSPYVKPLAKKIVHKASSSVFEVVSSVAEAMHGGNIHGAIIDELHVHKSPDLVEAIESGTGSRTQPLVAIITTADDGRQDTIYQRKRHRVEQLAVRVITDVSVYGVIWCADEADDPHSEKTWRKANPGLGISPTVAYLRRASLGARNDPAEMAKFLRLHLGIRTKLDKRYVALDVWDRNAGSVDERMLAGRECYGGLDLASTSDLTAVAWDFPDGFGGHDVIWRHWIPERAFDQLVKRTSGQARVWRDQGWLVVTDGDVTDYGFIREAINIDRENFDVRDVAYDRWNSSQLVIDLQGDEAPMTSMGQGYVSMSPPTKALLHTLLEGKPDAPRYRHGGNPLIRWQVDNLRVITDPAGNVKPAKDKSMDKIDGLVAGVMALERAINRPETRVSVYESHGMEIVG